MAKKTGGQLTPTPNRKTGSPAHGRGYGSLMERNAGKRPKPGSYGPHIATKGGIGQGGSGGARKGKRGK